MVAFFSIVLALLLLGATVFALHRYQTMEMEVSVDRSTPLPPLQNPPDTEAADSAAEQPSAASSPANTVSAVARDTSSLSWQEEVMELKRMGDILGALAVCKEEFPLWSAYNQACILLRSELKSADLSPEEKQERLKKLYQTAATAEFIHDKSVDDVKLPLSALRQLETEKAADLEMPYRELGYAHLRLIRKGDIKLMQEMWGRPNGHSKPRQFHREWWNTVVNSLD